jgi:hypothetical protein
MTALSGRRRRVIARVATALVLAAVAAGFVTGLWFHVRRLAVAVGLPAPVRLAVMSDLHLGARGKGAGMARRAVREAMAERPDAIVLVGDFVSGRAGIPEIPSVVAALHAPLGVYAVLGNHDHWADAPAVEAALESAGVRVLVNDSVVVRKGKARLALVGIDDLWAGSVDWDAAWRDVPKGVPVVLLSHNPDAATYEQGQRAALIVSGHTHAGKFRLPRFVHRALIRLTGRGLIPATAYGSAHPYGLMREKWGWVYITSGVTCGAPPRWYTRPEVAVVELR